MCPQGAVMGQLGGVGAAAGGGGTAALLGHRAWVKIVRGREATWGERSRPWLRGIPVGSLLPVRRVSQAGRRAALRSWEQLWGPWECVGGGHVWGQALSIPEILRGTRGQRPTSLLPNHKQM